MTKRSLKYLLKLGVVAAALLAWAARADLRARNDEQTGMILPTGQFVTPTALEDAVQQYLNPGLPAYPNFIAGEAVKSQLSPDGTTLAVLCAGQNSLYKSDGTLDTPASTQYIFLYDVSGANKLSPALTQVIP